MTAPVIILGLCCCGLSILFFASLAIARRALAIARAQGPYVFTEPEIRELYRVLPPGNALGFVTRRLSEIDNAR
jgi:hypothetical protein